MQTATENGRAKGLPFQGATPFPASQVRAHIARPKPGIRVYGFVVNHVIHGENVHFMDKRSHPCRAHVRACEWCGQGNRLRWYGYLPIVVDVTGRIALAELTYQAVKQAEARYHYDTLRGLWLQVERIGTSARGRCAIELDKRECRFRLPEPIDTQAALDAIWNEFSIPPALPFEEEDQPA